MAFSENIPAWLKAIPEELVSLVDLPGLYGLNLYCRAATIGLGAVMGVVGAGFAGPAGGGLTGFFVGKLSCDAIEDRAVRAKMCYEFNELVCPKRRLDIEKVRHPSIGVDPMQAKKCPPCPEKREMGEVSESISNAVTGGEQDPNGPYNGKLIVGNGEIGSANLQNALFCKEFSYYEGELTEVRSCTTDTSSGVGETSLIGPYTTFDSTPIQDVSLFDTTPLSLPVLESVIPDFAMPSNCPDSGPFAALIKASQNSGHLTQEQLVQDPDFVGSFCEIASQKVPVPVNCLPRLHLQSVIALSKSCT